MRRGLTATVALTVLPMAPGAPAAPVDYELTPTHSFVHFEWPHAGLSTLRGRFDKVSGRVTLDRTAGNGKGSIELRLDSVNTGRAALDTALRQGLGAEAPAVARFEIESLRLQDQRPTVALGRLVWRQRVLPLELRADHFNCYFNPLLRREVCGGEFQSSVEPAALGLTLDPAWGLGDPIVLRVQVEAIRQEPATEGGS